MGSPLDDLQIGTLKLFCLCADAGSFVAAAVAAGLTPPAVSRAIGRLEKRLGTRLFVRSTRQARMSDAGLEYYRHCKQILAQLDEAERQLNGQQLEATGLVRFSMPTSYGHYRILPLLAAFRGAHPKVQLELQISDHNVDFIAEGYDLAVRARTPPESGLVAMKLEDAALCVVGAPAYLQRKGVPLSLEDLAHHDCLSFALPSSGQVVPWSFRVDGKERECRVTGAITCTNAFLATVTLATEGAGLTQTYRYIVEEDIKAGALVEVLQPFAGASRPFSLLYPADRHMPRRVRVLVDYLLDATSPYRAR